MNTSAEILSAAKKHAEAAQFAYAGAITPTEAYALLLSDPQVKLIDVRTNAERDWVGRVAVAENQHEAIQWNLYPEGKQNPEFLHQLEQAASKDAVLLFMCRSGVRSRFAAQKATENGYTQCFDILEGFEGEKDSDGHRKLRSGWCHAGLPWVGG